MDLVCHDLYTGPVKDSVIYNVPSHPYLSICFKDVRSLKVDLTDITDDMLIDSGSLTAEDLYSVRGLDYVDDSVLWGFLVRPVFEDLSAESSKDRVLEFIALLRGLKFRDCSKFVENVNLLTIISHFVLSEYVVDVTRKNTKAYYFNKLIEILDSLFFQFILLRNRCEADVIQFVFSLLINPKEHKNDIPMPTMSRLKDYISDTVYYNYVNNAEYVTLLLCHCRRCRFKAFCRGVGRERKVAHGVFALEHLELLHMDREECERLNKVIEEDLGYTLLHRAINNKELPINKFSEDIGRTHRDMMILKVFYNIIFVMSLARHVKNCMERDLDLLRRTFLDLVADLRGSLTRRNSPLVRNMLSCLTHVKDVTAMEFPGTCVLFLNSAFPILEERPKNQHRITLLLEHLCMRKLECSEETFQPMKLVRHLRHDVLEGYLNSISLTYVSSPLRFSRLSDNNLYNVGTWRGLFPHVVPLSVRCSVSFEARLCEHRLRQKRIYRKRQIIKKARDRAFRAREVRRCVPA
ncbi:protein U4 [Suid betaherpesvirus 2]|uniref:Protein U4 n=1 Tax=Suid betaherpesvirus 2 TaxID=1608255 RepID=U3GPZ5_9BETA|nr:protein U4 [Suid betaherpesvirus 2]AGT99205.1 protein U4 [Suid betaherpesvirus 2]